MKFEPFLETSVQNKNNSMKQLINKHLARVSVYLLLSIFFVACSSGKQISSSSPAEITQAINNNQWTFSADYTMPAYGRPRNLTGGYFVTCRKDQLTVALPYYGKLNSPAGAMSGNPLDFQSTNIILNAETRKDGGWLVNIKPNNPEVQSMAFTFFDNGSAQLNVVMTNRSGINFSGKVAPVATAK
jgi:hypothetical protein